MICSINVVPERGMPTMRIGAADGVAHQRGRKHGPDAVQPAQRCR
jgi:hypothetical protein